MEDRIYLSPPHLSGEEKRFVEEAFDSNWVAPCGPNVDEFEQEMARYAGVRSAVALSSGTAALHLALKLTGVGPGDRVFCSSLTFAGSAFPILYCGGVPVFIDSEPETWNLSPTALKTAFEEAARARQLPKAVVTVNIYGQSADMDPIRDIAGKFEVPIIEDAAESLGATYKGHKSGTLGQYGIFSFNGNKIITTSGGGMLVSNDGAAIDKARFWSTQAKDPVPHYQHSELGFNYRMSNVLAGIGRGQLRVLEERVATRRAIFDTYQEALGTIPGFSFMPEAPYGRANRWLTTLTVNPAQCGFTRDDVLNILTSQNIEARPVWKPMHMQPVFKACAYYPHFKNRSVCEDLFERGLCLPSGSNLSKKDQQRVIDVMLSMAQRSGSP
jgi:pyridoxal phosphate-dependent aminotransferase EpsN